MGTRNLTMVKLGGKLFGQYGQWDGYPEGQGLTALRFLQNGFDEEKFKANFEKAVFLTDKEIEERWENAGAEPGAAFVGMDVADEFKRNNMHLSRDMGAKILKYIQETSNPELQNGIAFAADSLFCEWGYMVDLDARELQCFRGFNRKPLARGQFFENLKPLEKGYYPIEEIKSFKFDELKAITFSESKDFVAVLQAIAYPNEEE